MSRSRRASLRKTPTSLNTMTISDFVRGGVYDLKEATVIVTHGEPLGMWTPRDKYEAALAYQATTTDGTTSYLNVSNSPDVNLSGSTSSTLEASSTRSTVNVDALNSAVDKLHEYLNRLPQATDEEGKNG